VAGGIPPEARYACPMETHPGQEDPNHRGAYFSAEPGECPWCGMKLKPIDDIAWARARRAAESAEVAYTCPDHQYVLSTKPGECPRCGKTLQPFKVMYTCPNPEHASLIYTHPGVCPEDGRKLVPFRGIWLSERMAAQNVPPHPEVAEGAAYHCPMHPLVHSAHPGDCTICGRALQPTAQPRSPESVPAPQFAPGTYVCPMHPDQISDRPGRCNICGMRLVPAEDFPQPKTAPEAVQVQMNHLMEHYLALQQRLAADRTEGAAKQALGVIAAADELEKLLSKPGVGLPNEFGLALTKLREAAVKMRGEDLAASRVAFVDLSAALRTMVELARPSREKYARIYVFHCPMSKGDWLQTSEQMKNPYYGFAMLKCGILVGTE
jgi:hypothetical protein